MLFLLRWANLLVLLLPLFSTSLAAAERPRITLIIDDLGYALKAGRRAVELPGPVAYAVLPQTPRARALAAYASAQGKEVLLHQPLQSMDTALAAEPGGMTLDMSRRQLAAVLDSNLKTLPQAIGVNGHRGSLLSRHPGHMAWLMHELKDRDLFFIDSYTTEHSVALSIAGETGIPTARRDVFLDNDPSPAAVAREFERLKRLARIRGRALAIGHPYPATLEFLERALPALEEEGFRLTGLSDYLRINQAAEPPAQEPIAPAGRIVTRERSGLAGEKRTTSDGLKNAAHGQ